MRNEALYALSPLDGRYRPDVAGLREHFSEFALMRNRVLVEVEYFISLAGHPEVTFLGGLTMAEMHALRELYRGFGDGDAARVKQIEAQTGHDVKAVEYFIRERMAGTSMQGMVTGIHFGLTSADINNLAYALSIKRGLLDVVLPALDGVHIKLSELVEQYQSLPMLARTHGQPASPTTLGKEFAVFAGRLAQQHDMLVSLHRRIPGKLNGATGNFNAHVAAYPEIDWIDFSKDFIVSLGLAPSLLTTQVEANDTLAALCHNFIRVNIILLDLCRDVWRYISDAYLIQGAVEEETGSSTMPHKVNPIQFENAEGNLEVANALLDLMARRLPLSRLQRDLSNSTLIRNMGAALGHSVLAYKNVQRGLGRIAANPAQIEADLSAHWEVITEAVQTVLRREGVSEAYELLKKFSRGASVRRADMEAFIHALDLAPDIKQSLLQLRPETYIGLAEALAARHQRA